MLKALQDPESPRSGAAPTWALPFNPQIKFSAKLLQVALPFLQVCELRYRQFDGKTHRKETIIHWEFESDIDL